MKRTQRTKKAKSYSLHYLIAGVLLFIISVAASYLYFKPRLAFKSPFIENIESQRLEAKFNKAEEDSLRLYKSQQEGLPDDIKLQRRDLLVRAEDVIRAYMETLSVKLLDLYMDKDGIIYADFSSELRKNFNGDAFEEYQIIADLYKRIKINVTDFNSLKILIDGKEVESFGGHIDISRPIGERVEDVDQRKTDRYF